MPDFKVSLFGSFARPKDWEWFWGQLSMNTIEYQIVMMGPNKPDNLILPDNVMFGHVQPDPGPALCCFLASKYCTGETMMQVGDDMVFTPYALDEVYNTYKRENDYKCMVHCRYGFGPDSDVTDVNTELKIPGSDKRWGLGCLYSRQFYWELGGIDKRYHAGATDGEVQLRAYSRSGRAVYASNAYVQEDLTRTPGPQSGNALNFERAWYRWGGQTDNEIMRQQWFPDGVLLNESTTPFQPIETVVGEA